ncbi:MAG: hypothetical protein H0W65_06225 [Sphingomonas sp.]|nr:hypothetical protein [Sphingomonas sp.]
MRIAMTVAEAGPGEGRLIEVEHEAGLDSDEPELRFSEVCGVINANLSVGPNPTSAQPLLANAGMSFRGVTLIGKGFVVTPIEARALGLGKREGLEQHIRPYKNGRDLVQNPRAVMAIDLFGLSELEVRQRYPEVYQYLLVKVKELKDEQGIVIGRDSNRRGSYRNRWWIFGEPRGEQRPSLVHLSRYIATTQTARHRMFEFLSRDIIPDQQLIVVASNDPGHLGILSSHIHAQWALRVGGTLEDRPRYNNTSVFDPFPFPDASPEQRIRIGDLAEELDATRKAALAEVPRLTMTEIYNFRERIAAGEQLAGHDLDRATAARAFIVNRLHEQIDAAVAVAYGWSADLAPAEIVARLVALNTERKAEEEAGTIRWLRPDYQQPRFGQ